MKYSPTLQHHLRGDAQRRLRQIATVIRPTVPIYLAFAATHYPGSLRRNAERLKRPTLRFAIGVDEMFLDYLDAI
jgi:hypothetical protein